MQAQQFSPPQPHQNQNHNLDPSLMPHMNMNQMPNQNQAAQLPQRMRGQNMAGSPTQGSMLQPNVAGYQVQPGMWQGFDPAMQDPQGHSPSDTLSNASAQAVPMTMNVEDW